MRFICSSLVLSACATTAPVATPTGGPRGLRATDHLDLAHQQDDAARARRDWPSSNPIVTGTPELGQPVVMPWYRTWDTAADHERLAAIHRSKAAELQGEYEEACGDRPSSEVSVSPLVRFGVGGWPTASGVIVYLSPKVGTPDQLLAAMRCHRAFMMLAPADMDDCPLDLPGLVLDARGDSDGVTVSLSVDRKLVPELQRRTAHDLEAAQHAQTPH